MKNKYVTPASEVLYFETEDVIMTSGGGEEEVFAPTANEYVKETDINGLPIF